MIVTTMFALIALASGQPPAAGTVQRSQAIGSLNIPDEIGAAIAPYMRCKVASAGIQTRASPGGPIIPQTIPVGADCTQVRAQAAVNADRMLREQGRTSADERRALIERTLASVDTFLGSIPAIPPQQ